MAELRTAHQQDPFWSPESIAAQVTLEALAAPSKDEVTRKQADRPYRVEAWPSDFGKGPLCHVLSQIIEHAARTPILEEDTAKLDEKARTNLQRWTAKMHEELRLLRRDADSLSYDAVGRLLSSDKTDGFLKQRLFPLIDRWDALFGVVTPEHPPKESLSSVARRVLLRVWHGLLFWLRNQGITPEVPLQVAFSDARHHAQHWVPKGSDPAGQIIAVVRSRLHPRRRTLPSSACGRNQVIDARETAVCEGSPSENPFTPHALAFPAQASASHRTDHSDPEAALAPARATSGNSLWESKILLH